MSHAVGLPTDACATCPTAVCLLGPAPSWVGECTDAAAQQRLFVRDSIHGRRSHDKVAAFSIPSTPPAAINGSGNTPLQDSHNDRPQVETITTLLGAPVPTVPFIVPRRVLSLADLKRLRYQRPSQHTVFRTGAFLPKLPEERALPVASVPATPAPAMSDAKLTVGCRCHRNHLPAGVSLLRVCLGRVE